MSLDRLVMRSLVPLSPQTLSIIGAFSGGIIIFPESFCTSEFTSVNPENVTVARGGSMGGRLFLESEAGRAKRSKPVGWMVAREILDLVYLAINSIKSFSCLMVVKVRENSWDCSEKPRSTKFWGSESLRHRFREQLWERNPFPWGIWQDQPWRVRVWP